MHTKHLGGLIAINIALLVILTIVTIGPRVSAGNAEFNANRATGDFIMVGGMLSGKNIDAVYVLDQRSGLLIGLQYDLSSRRMKDIDVLNLTKDAERAGPGR